MGVEIDLALKIFFTNYSKSDRTNTARVVRK